MNFEINFFFMMKPFFGMTKKSGQKLEYLENEKGFYKMKWKAFFIIFKGLSMKQII